MRYALRYGCLPFERAQDHARTPPPCRETPSNARPIVTPRQPSLAKPLLHHIYTFLFAGELGGRGERRVLAVGAGGRAAGRRGGVGCVDPGRFCGRNGAILHAPSENLAVGCDFSVLSVGSWRCSMRAYAFRIAALHSGMRVVCVRVREKSPLHPLPKHR